MWYKSNHTASIAIPGKCRIRLVRDSSKNTGRSINLPYFYQMIKALIIDDEQVAVNVLSLMIERHLPEITTIKSLTNPGLAIQLIADYKPDIVFLDIEMPYQNGFELLKSLPEIIF